MNNPYITSPWVKESNFYGRHEMIEKLMDTNGGLIWLVGNRKVGKTSLLRKLEENSYLQNQMIPIYLDISGLKMFSDLSGRLYRATTFGDGKRFLNELSIDLTSYRNVNFFDLQYELLVRLDEKHRGLFLLVDEAEGLLKLLENDRRSEELNSITRMASEWCNYSDRMKVIIASSTRLKALSRYDSLTTSLLAQFSEQYYVGPLLDSEAIDLIRQKNNPAGCVNVTDETVLDILEITGCHPLFIQLLCQKLFRRDSNSLNMIDESIRIANDTVQSVLVEDLKALSVLEKQILLGLINHEPDTKCTKSKHELSKELRISDTKMSAFIKNFTDLGMIKESPKGRYQIMSEYFYSWLIASQDEIEADIVREIEEKEPKVKSITIKRDVTGYTYQKLFGPYLKGARRIIISEPYLYDKHQILNFLAFVNILDTTQGQVSLHLITTSNKNGENEEQVLSDKFSEMVNNFSQNGIVFSFEFDNSEHAHPRWIVTDNGWKIGLDRGLHIYQKVRSNNELGIIDQGKRKCLETDIFYARNYDQEFA